MNQLADLREQVARAIIDDCGDLLTPAESASLSDAVLAVFAERERLLRKHIEALPRFNVRSEVDPEQVQRALVALDDVLGVFDDES